MSPLNSEFAAQQRKQWWVLGVLLAFCGVLLSGTLYHQYGLTLEHERERLLVQVRVVDTNLAQQLSGANAALNSIRDDIAFLRQTGLDTHGVKRLQALSDAMPGVRTMLITDAQALVLACNRPEIMGRNVGQRAYFRLPQANPKLETLYVSEPFETTLKVFSLNLVKVLPDETGQFAGIVTATLDPDFFQVLMRSVIYAADMRTTLVHGAGKVVLVEPADNAARGRDLSGPDSMLTRHQHSGRNESLWEGKDDISGDLRIAAFRTVWPESLQFDQPIIVAVSRDVSVVLAPWQQLSEILALTYAVLALFFIATLVLFQRKQRDLLSLQALRDLDEADHTERMDLALKGADLGLWDLDVASGQRTINARAYDMVGDDPTRPADDFRTWSHRIHPEDLIDARVARLAHEAGETDALTVDYRLRHREGHWVWIHSRGKVTHRDAGGKPLRIIGTYLDITERKAAEAQISEFAYHDALTGLPNRRLLMDRLLQAQHSSARSGKAGALMFLDLDRFKWVNDTLGHDLGDVLLEQVARRLVACVRQNDTVARLGGDEFVLIVQDLGDVEHEAPERARMLADKVLHAMRQPVMLGSHSHTVTTSLGIAIYEGLERDVTTLFKSADAAMYRAKSLGRNTACIEGVETMDVDDAVFSAS